MLRSRLVLLVLFAAVAGSAWWFFAKSQPRRLTIGDSLAVEFAFEEQVVVLLQTRDPSQAWAPFGYATFAAGYRVELFLSGEIDEALVTIGVGGTLHDTMTGKDLAEVPAGASSAARTDRKLEIRGATPMAELQTVKGTLLSVDLEGSVLLSSARRIDGR